MNRFLWDKISFLYCAFEGGCCLEMFEYVRNTTDALLSSSQNVLDDEEVYGIFKAN